MESDELQQYYAELACDGGFEARCHMELPERSLVGARIVNVGCRRGKGTYKLSEQRPLPVQHGVSRWLP